MNKYIAYFSCGTQIEVKAPDLLKAIKTARSFRAARGTAIGDFFTAAPEGVTVVVPRVFPLIKKEPYQTELWFGEIAIQYKEEE